MGVSRVYILGLGVHIPCCVGWRLLWDQGGSKIRATRGTDQGSQGGSKGTVGGNKRTRIKEEVLGVLKGL